METTSDIGVTPQARNALVLGPPHLLADSYTPYPRTDTCLWNVTGPQFNPLHLLFGTRYMEPALAADLVAERIRAPGEKAPGSCRALAAMSTVTEDGDSPDATTMVRRLVVGQEAVVRTARRIPREAQAAADEPTADLLTQRLQVNENSARMLRSRLES